MNLDEFIKNSLVDIRKGLRNGNLELGKEFGGEGPFSLGERNAKIDFDIAVTIENNTKGNVGGGIKVAVANLGSQMENETKASNFSRIRFSVYTDFNFIK